MIRATRMLAILQAENRMRERLALSTATNRVFPSRSNLEEHGLSLGSLFRT